MAANKRKQDDKHLKSLREMVTLSHNKQCFDCNQRGPTYVNMTIGSFVCTSCSGMLRGLTPPNRVKSISMTSFTPEEMEFLKSRGNGLCRQVWLGLYDMRSHMEPDHKDDVKIRDFMCQKYEKKRWYVAPSETMFEEARKMNTPAIKADTKQSRMIGNMGRINLPKDNSVPAVVAPPVTNQAIQRVPPKSQSSEQPTLQQTAAAATSAAVAAEQQQQAKPVSAFDLLGELGGDPFSNKTTGAGNLNNQGSDGSFADFSAFSQAQQPASFPGNSFPHTVQQPPTQAAVPPFAAFGAAPAPAPIAAPNPITGPPQAPATVAPGPGVQHGDRYAALADLDSVFNVTTSPDVNWNDNSWSGAQQPPANMTTVQASAATNGTAQTNTSTTQFGATPGMVNPFGADTSNTAPVGNPFMVGNPAPVAGFNQFPPQPGAMPAVGAAQFGVNPVPATNNIPAGSMPNGTYPVGQTFPVSQGQPFPVSQPQGFPTSQPQGFPISQGFPVSQPLAQPFQTTAAQPAGFPTTQQGGFLPTQQWPVTGQGFAANPYNMATPGMVPAGSGFGKSVADVPQQWPTQPGVPTGNPFMSSGAQPAAIPPKSGSTNPFL